MVATVLVAAGLGIAATAGAATRETGRAKAATAPADLNAAAQAQLEAVPGPGLATAKRIIAGRPYSSAADLAKAGVPFKTIEKTAPLVTVGAAAAPAQAGLARTARKTEAVGGQPVDLNSANEKELESLPGVGPATAREIVAVRPYTSVADLSGAGVPAGTIAKITPLVAIGAAAPAAAPAPVVPVGAQSAAATATGTVAQVPPVKGMAWVRLETRVFQLDGDKWYGATEEGKFMTEQDALPACYREAKLPGKKQAEPEPK